MFQPYDTITIDNQSALWALNLNPDLDNTCYDESGKSSPPPPLFNLSPTNFVPLAQALHIRAHHAMRRDQGINTLITSSA